MYLRTVEKKKIFLQKTFLNPYRQFEWKQTFNALNKLKLDFLFVNLFGLLVKIFEGKKGWICFDFFKYLFSCELYISVFQVFEEELFVDQDFTACLGRIQI